MKALIIAEKPSVARDIAAALGVGSAMENDNLVISHCIGHLVQLTYPLEQNQALPILPKEFDLKVIDTVKDQFKKLAALMKRPDVQTIINACDAGREGELIFRLVYDLVKTEKPIERMWLQSMTPEAIKTAYTSRKQGIQYQSLYDAARSRSEADWLYGINGSRAVKSAVGRVMTPTLAMVVERYEANTNFTPQTFYEVIANFAVTSGTYQGKLSKENKDVRFSSKEKAESIVERFKTTDPCKIEETKELKKKLPPLLFHLTGLQQEANRQFGYSAAETLAITQALYEKHKTVTYPRTDSNALPSDYLDTASQTLKSLVTAFPAASTIIENNWLQLDKRIFNDAMISDHFAIVPTGKSPSALTEAEQNIYDLIVKRFIAVFYPAAEYEHTSRITHVDQALFKTTGNVLTKPGWLTVYGGIDKSDDGKDQLLTPVNAGELAKLLEISVKAGKTKPPALFNEATLLKAMETAGKEIDNEELALVLKGKGIGTPATRAAIIEKLKQATKAEPYLKLVKKSLVPTERGLKLIQYLRQAAPTIISPELTGEWEYKLGMVERGQLTRTNFMLEINQAVYDLVSSLPQYSNPASVSKSLGQCPVCKQADLVDRKFSYMCECGFKINKEISGYTLKDKDIEAIIQNGKTHKIQSFKSKAGKDFSAVLAVDSDSKKLAFKF